MRYLSHSIIVCLQCLAVVLQAQPNAVEISGGPGSYVLSKGGSPITINGITGGFDLSRWKTGGANTVYLVVSDTLQSTLHTAQQLGLNAVIELPAVERGFNHKDSIDVKRYRETIHAIVKAYRDDPAVLMWAVALGAEKGQTRTSFWLFIERLIQEIQEVDADHPVMVMVEGPDVASVQLMQVHAPSVDVLGVLPTRDWQEAGKKVHMYGWSKPYVLAGWGVTSMESLRRTTWGAPVVPSGARHSKTCWTGYKKTVSAEFGFSLGSFYTFDYSETPLNPLLIQNKAATNTAQTLQLLWTDVPAPNSAPKIQEFRVNDRRSTASVKVEKGGDHQAKVVAEDPEGGRLTYQWEVVAEEIDEKNGTLVKLNSIIVDTKDNVLLLKAPDRVGAYRLYTYVTDAAGNTAYDSFPFFVE